MSDVSIPVFKSAAFDFLPHPTIVVSHQGTVTAANYAANTLFDPPRQHTLYSSASLVSSEVKILPVFIDDTSTARRHFVDILAEFFCEVQSTEESEDPEDGKRSRCRIGTAAVHVREINIVVVLPTVWNGESPSSESKNLRMLATISLWILAEKHYATVSFGIRKERPEQNHTESFPAELRSRASLCYGMLNDVVPRGEQGFAKSTQARKGQLDEDDVLRMGMSIHKHTPSTGRADATEIISRLSNALQYRAGRPGFIISADESIAIAKYTEGSSIEHQDIGDAVTFFGGWKLWDQSFTYRLPLHEYPVLVLNRTRINYDGRRFGIVEESGIRVLFDTIGECLYDPSTKEYVGGVLWVRKLGTLEEVMAQEEQERLRSFQTLCESMPHLVWTSQPDGSPDYFSNSFYQFVGCARDMDLKLAWPSTINADDITKFDARVQQGVHTGTEWEIEIRVDRPEGRYTWMVARAKPLKNTAGNVLKWYGTLTDVHDIVVTRIDADKARMQQMAVLSHSEVVLYKINTDWMMTMVEGNMVWTNASSNDDDKTQVLGSDLRKYLLTVEEDGCPTLVAALNDVMTGRKLSTVVEWGMSDKWFRARLIADMKGSSIVGVLGCSIDVTEARARMRLETENVRLEYARKVAQDGNRMKSQFLANVSRTPADLSRIIGQ